MHKLARKKTMHIQVKRTGSVWNEFQSKKKSFANYVDYKEEKKITVNENKPTKTTTTTATKKSPALSAYSLYTYDL